MNQPPGQRKLKKNKRNKHKPGETPVQDGSVEASEKKHKKKKNDEDKEKKKKKKEKKKKKQKHSPEHPGASVSSDQSKMSMQICKKLDIYIYLVYVINKLCLNDCQFTLLFHDLNEKLSLLFYFNRFLER